MGENTPAAERGRKQPSLFKLALAMLVVAACVGAASAVAGGSAQSIPVFRVGSTTISTLNYDKSNSGYYYGMGQLVLEPLVVLSKDGKIEPWLARSWNQSGPKTYLYHLRKGVTFSDGAPLTARDVVFSLNFYRKQGSANSYNFPSTLKSITAVGSDTVKITLSAPNAAWAVIPTGAQLGIFEQKFYEQHKDTFGQPGTGVIGTGPWQITKFDPTSGAQLTANPHYWGGAPAIKQIQWTFYSSETSEALAFRSGEIDLAFPSDNKSFASTAGTKLVTAPGEQLEIALSMNTLTAPWSDVHVRRAVAYAIDRRALIQAYGGYAQPAYTLIPPVLLRQLGSQSQINAALRGVPTYPHSVAKAKAEMRKSAFPNGAKVTLAALNQPAIVNMTQVLKSQLAAIGLKATIKVENVDPNTAEITGSDRKAVQTQIAPYGGVSPDPGGIYDYALGSKNATGGNWNSSNWSSPLVDKLIAKGFSTTAPASRLKIYGQLLTQLGQNAPYVPIAMVNGTVALASKYTWPTFDSFWANLGPWALGIRAGK
jgi:peptide/nickel transport system substrate-binding protein